MIAVTSHSFAVVMNQTTTAAEQAREIPNKNARTKLGQKCKNGFLSFNLVTHFICSREHGKSEMLPVFPEKSRPWPHTVQEKAG